MSVLRLAAMPVLVREYLVDVRDGHRTLITVGTYDWRHALRLELAGFITLCDEVEGQTLTVKCTPLGLELAAASVEEVQAACALVES